MNVFFIATQPTVTSNSKIPNPQKAPQKEKDYGFKIAPDGRFIITDDKEKDSDAEEGNKKKRKKGASFLSDSEDDYSNYFALDCAYICVCVR